jgi:hypothetical protein
MNDEDEVQENKVHWHLMNGEPGCLPDSNSVFETEEAALEYAQEFLELTDDEVADLAVSGIYYPNSDRKHEIGAGVIELYDCEDSDCLEDNY